MSNITLAKPIMAHAVPIRKIKAKRIESIDLLRGVVMIIMALDHVRDYFHKDAFLYNPEDLNHTNVFLFFTRWITHYCAPVFVFLAGVSAYLYGVKSGKKKLSFFLFTRGIWLVLAEIFIISLFRTFNPSYHFINLQVIWAIGISMIVLSAMIYMNPRLIALTGFLLIAFHNLLDNIHVTGNGISSFLWALLHEPEYFNIGEVNIHVHYPLLPWIGIMAIGYCFGSLYTPGYDPKSRRKTIFYLGFGAIFLFIILRSPNFYGDAAYWSLQQNAAFSLLSFLNVTKYPPSLLYTLITLGPALIFLALTEMPLNAFTKKITVIGRVPMFYYLVHILFIHLFAVVGAVILGYKWSDMVLSTMVQRAPTLRGYGFNLFIVYIVWAGLVLILYRLCKWFDQYKRSNQSAKWWLSYL
ncbi:MAG TPA: heparan-alpha-glucosaminide N-acetyltransferase domain-containing protein [Chitinophagaceae bacterium]|jgi:uncharacterized membrane protein|nr:heparan-alpha-glucosaminide N-acetyltransferase domain-containing protein [Chitinophagaceae bacterium]